MFLLKIAYLQPLIQPQEGFRFALSCELREIEGYWQHAYELYIFCIMYLKN